MTMHQTVDTYRGFRLGAASHTHVDVVSDDGPVNRSPVPVDVAREYVDRRVFLSTRSAVGQMLSRLAMES